MPCYHQLNGWQHPEVLTEKGKKKVFFLKKPGPYPGMVECPVPCGQCRGCRHAKALEWTIRCVHESTLHKGNSFITLTFNDENLNRKGTLVEDDFKNFMKRLRKYFLNPPIFFSKEEKNLWYEAFGIRFYHCGEYGEDLARPHHHAIIFNQTFPDKKPWKENLYRSEALERCWSKQIKKSQIKKYKKENVFQEHGKFYTKLGYSTIGSANYDTIAYVARYVVKKITGKLAPDHYQGRLPEYNSMSTTPGIARRWYELYKQTDVFPRDYILLRGKRLKVPKYYSKCYDLTNPDEYGTIRDMRIQNAKNNPNYHPDRLKAAEKIQIARDSQIKRKYESHA